MSTSEAVLTCGDCAAGHEHCHDVSIEHADGSTECMDPSCEILHCLHVWQVPCSVLVPPCPCSPEEHVEHQPWFDLPVLEAA